MTGSVIPCTLITGINSDLPGAITCDVRQNVFYSPSGQRRVLVVWHRLQLPNGDALDLLGMPGVDLSDYTGYVDKVDNHWGQMVRAVLLSSMFSVAPSAVVGNNETFNRSIESEVARQIGSNVQQAGDQIVRSELTVQPILQLRQGLTINVFVQTDVLLRPYTAPAIHEIQISRPTNRY